MSEQTKITCDQCQHDLTYTGNCEDYYVVLGNQSKGHYPGAYAVTSMAICPAIKGGTKHFCGVGCLAMWLTNEYPNAGAEYERVQKHRAWLKESERKSPNPPPSP